MQLSVSYALDSSHSVRTDGTIVDETRLDSGAQNIGNMNLAADKMKTIG
jgi:hypothetical protein